MSVKVGLSHIGRKVGSGVRE